MNSSKSRGKRFRGKYQPKDGLKPDRNTAQTTTKSDKPKDKNLGDECNDGKTEMDALVCKEGEKAVVRNGNSVCYPFQPPIPEECVHENNPPCYRTYASVANEPNGTGELEEFEKPRTSVRMVGTTQTRSIADCKDDCHSPVRDEDTVNVGKRDPTIVDTLAHELEKCLSAPEFVPSTSNNNASSVGGISNFSDPSNAVYFWVPNLSDMHNPYIYRL